MARCGTILQDVVRREVQKLIGFALLNLSWFNPFVLHHGKAHWQWLWQVHKYLVEPWQEKLKWGQVTSETKRCTFTSPLRTSWTQPKIAWTAGRQGFVCFVIGAGRSFLWVMWVHVSNESDSCTKVLQFRGPPQMPISATFRHRNKKSMYHVSFQFREEYSRVFSSSSDISQPRKILQLLRGNDWVGLSPSTAFAFLGALGWEKAPEFLGFWPHNWSPQAWHLVSSSGMG